MPSAAEGRGLGAPNWALGVARTLLLVRVAALAAVGGFLVYVGVVRI